jgi:cobalamin biosynthetic protein CobC
MPHKENKNETTVSLVHGGQLNQMASRYHRPIEKWLDLSTGISPISYPIPYIPQEIWQQLPQTSDRLVEVAKRYYGTESISVTSGSQAVIARLPSLYLKFVKKLAINIDVWLPEVGYKEHEKSWRDSNFNIKKYNSLPSTESLAENAIVVVINPNNPTGELHQQQSLRLLLQKIEQCSGWLIVDEAFMDVVKPNQSIIHLTSSKHLLVLRSFGKFFGLAGIRIGFLSAHPHWIDKVNQISSPWEVNGPAQYIAEQALNDQGWQDNQHEALTVLSKKLEQLLSKTFLSTQKRNSSVDIRITGCELFKTITHPQASTLHDLLCRQGLYIRLCDEKNALRFGIPNQDQCIILEKLLAEHCHS